MMNEYNLKIEVIEKYPPSSSIGRNTVKKPKNIKMLFGNFDLIFEN